MADFAPNDLVILLLAISTMLILSRIASEIGRKFGLPMVMGELLVGVALGPTLLGTLLPGVYDTIFPFADNANFARSLETIFSLSVILLLFVAGLELRFSLFLEYGVVALTTGIGSMVLPFVSGFALAWYFPAWFSVAAGGSTHLLFALFLGTAMSISALPVIARILLDMKLLKTDVGAIIIASAVFNDIVGWFVFSFILSMVGQGNGDVGIVRPIIAIIAFAVCMLLFSRFLLNRILPWIQTRPVMAGRRPVAQPRLLSPLRRLYRVYPYQCQSSGRSSPARPSAIPFTCGKRRGASCTSSSPISSRRCFLSPSA